MKINLFNFTFIASSGQTKCQKIGHKSCLITFSKSLGQAKYVIRFEIGHA